MALDVVQELIVKITADSRALQAEMAKATGVVKGESSAMARAAGTASRIGKVAFLGLAAGAAAVGGASVKLALDYQDSTNKIAANADITVKKAKAITKAFLTTAGKTTFDANTIAVAYGSVAAQLGTVQGHALSAGQALKFMDTATALAEASGGDLTTTTAGLSAVMQAYGLQAGKAGMASDVLYTISRKTNVPVDTLAGGIAKLHARLGESAPSLSDVGALVTDLGKQGITGSRGILMISSAFNHATSTSSSVTDELKKLGVSLYDANGQFIGMPATIGKLNKAMADMTQKQKDEAGATIFGTTGWRLLQPILDKGRAAFEKTSQSVGKSGSASKGAERAMKGLKAQWEILTAWLHDKLIPIGQRVIKWLMQTIHFVQRNSEVFKNLAALIGTVLVAAIGIYLVNAIQKAVLAVKGFFLLLETNPFILLATAVAVIVVLIITHWKTVKDFLSKTWDWIKKTSSGIWHALERATGAMVGFVLDMMAGFLHFYLVDVVGGIVHGAAVAFGWVPGLGDKLKRNDAAFHQWANGVTGSLKQAADQARHWGDTQSASTDKAKKGTTDYTVALHGVPGHVTTVMQSDTTKARRNVESYMDWVRSQKITLQVTASGVQPSVHGVAVGPGMKHVAAGGPIHGAGSSDTVPAMLTPGEFVFNRKAVQKMGGLGKLDELHKAVQRFAGGGPVLHYNLSPAGRTIMADLAKTGEAASAARQAASTGPGNAMVAGISGPIVAMFKKIAALFGWGSGAEWSALNQLEMHEAGYNPNAQNPVSSAYGLGQFLDSTWAGYGPKTSDPKLQALYMLRYIKGRYGDPINAWAGYFGGNLGGPTGYDQGGMLPPGLSLAYNGTGKPERVTPAGEAGGHVINVTNHITSPFTDENRMRSVMADVAHDTAVQVAQEIDSFEGRRARSGIHN